MRRNFVVNEPNVASALHSSPPQLPKFHQTPSFRSSAPVCVFSFTFFVTDGRHEFHFVMGGGGAEMRNIEARNREQRKTKKIGGLRKNGRGVANIVYTGLVWKITKFALLSSDSWRS